MQREFNPEEVELAHPGKRYQAQFIDGLIALALFALCIYFLRLLDVEGAVFNVVIFLIPFSYFALADALPGGQSVGKKPFGMAVISKDTGKPCSILQSFLRNAFSPILGVIDAVLIFGKERQRLGDVFANTIVIQNG